MILSYNLFFVKKKGELFMSENSEKKDKKSLDELLEEGIKLCEMEKLYDAIEVLRKAVEFYPDSALAHYNLSVAYAFKLKKDIEHSEVWEDKVEEESYIEEAINELDMAISIDPKMKEAYKDLGKLYALTGEIEKAIENYEMSLSLDPNQPGIREELQSLRGK